MNSNRTAFRSHQEQRRARGITAFHRIDDGGNEYWAANRLSVNGPRTISFDSFGELEQWATDVQTFVRRTVDLREEDAKAAERRRARQARRDREYEESLTQEAFRLVRRYGRNHPMFETNQGERMLLRYQATIAQWEKEGASNG